MTFKKTVNHDAGDPIFITGKVPHNPPDGDITEEGYFDGGIVPEGSMLNHVVFSEPLAAGAPNFEFQSSVCTITFSETLGEYKPTRAQKIKDKISKAFHPLTKYRIRLVNTDWDCYDD